MHPEPNAPAQYIHVGPQADPIPMRARSFVCGGCGGPCFYCGRSLSGAYHEHDHMPIPWRHGGKVGVPACVACHDLKDRSSLNDWTPAQLEAVAAGVGLRLHIISATWASERESRTADHIGRHVARIQPLEAVQECTTAEARIWAARFLAFIADDAEYVARPPEPKRLCRGCADSGRQAVAIRPSDPIRTTVTIPCRVCCPTPSPQPPTGGTA